jgi:sugar O-acyltransferase (sialic acid O-acetyltransferase NeuD family)
VRLFLSKPLLIIGAGGHASVLVDILRQQKREILGVVSPQIESKSKVFDGIQHFKSDDDVLKFDNQSVNLVNGIGSLPGNHLRAVLFNKFKTLGFEFETVVANNAIVSDYVELAEGVQIFTGAIVQTNVSIGTNTIINTGSIIEHDCAIGRHNHIAPGVTLSGQVTTSEYVHIGTGASVIQSVSIGNNVVIGSGTTITKNIAKNMVCLSARITQKVLK